MKVGTANTRKHTQVAGIVFRAICIVYGLDPNPDPNSVGISHFG